MVYKKINNEYVIRYNDVNEMNVAPLQLKINDFYCKMYKLQNNITSKLIKSNDEKLFIKIREIWKKITELIGINSAKDFVKNTTNNADECIVVDVHKNASFVEGNYSGGLTIVLHSVINNYLKTSLIQVKNT